MSRDIPGYLLCEACGYRGSTTEVDLYRDAQEAGAEIRVLRAQNNDLRKQVGVLRAALQQLVTYPNPNSPDGSDTLAEYGDRERAALEAARAALAATATAPRLRGEAEREAARRDGGAA